MTTKNDITGDLIKSRASTDSYRANWDNIFKKKPKSKSRNNRADKKTDSDLP